ncbi:MAG: hypothetical protein V3W14_05645 [Candidatus Neomarinimicrobiota bacterium]
MSNYQIPPIWKAFLLVFFIYWSCNSPTGPSADESFSQIFGGDEYDAGFAAVQTYDGGYLIGGTTFSRGSGWADFWLLKLDQFGNEQVNRVFGGSDWDRLKAAQQVSDAGFVLFGYKTVTAANNTDMWLVKTNSSGILEWQTTYGGGGDEVGWDIRETFDGGYIMVGSTESTGAGGTDLWLVRTDYSGTELWSYTFGGAGYDAGRAVRQTADSGFVAAGMTASTGAGGMDGYLVRTDRAGVKLWSKTYGGSAEDSLFALQILPDGGYILAGTTTSSGAGGIDALLIKTDSTGGTGGLGWTKTFGGPAEDIIHDVALSDDGGCVLAGTTRPSEVNDLDIWLLKVDQDGEQVWSREFDGDGADDWGEAVSATEDGGFIVTGSIWNSEDETRDLWIKKTTPKGR